MSFISVASLLFVLHSHFLSLLLGCSRPSRFLDIVFDPQQQQDVFLREVGTSTTFSSRFRQALCLLHITRSIRFSLMCRTDVLDFFAGAVDVREYLENIMAKDKEIAELKAEVRDGSVAA